MSYRIPTLLALLATSILGYGQIGVGLQLPENQFLSGEALPVSVRITNFSGRTLAFGRDNFWLQFQLELRNGRPIASLSNVPVQGEFTLTNSMVATKRVNITPHYPPLLPGEYALSASVRVREWQTVLRTQPDRFHIIRGTTLWEQPFGLPAPAGATTPPEVRRYAIQQAVHLERMKLYVRVTDATGSRPFAAFPLGPMLTFSTPEKQIDRESNLHVLYQYGARSFYYCIVDPDGKLLLRHTYDYTTRSRPVLGTDEAGKIIVRGGARRPTLHDIPTESEEDPGEENKTESTESSPTNAPPAVPSFDPTG